MNVIDQFGLRQDPFSPASSATGFGVAASLLAAREKLLAAISRGDPLTVLAGRPGMGKTLLLAMVEEACRSDGIEVRSVARGDIAHVALGSRAQLLLIDEADTINTATLKALAPGSLAAAAPTMVFAAARPALHRLSSDVRATIIDLRPLDADEARDFLLARTGQAGRLDLFTPEALDLTIEAGQGSPRLLRVLAGAAMFQAASDGAAQITAAHAGLAAAMHGKLLSTPTAEPALPPAANDLEPLDEAAEDRPRTLVPLALRRPSASRRLGALSFAASVALAALVLPVFFFPEATDAPSVSVATANAAQAVSGPVQLAATFTVAPASAAAPLPPLRPLAGAEASLRRVPTLAPPLIAAPLPRIATAAIDRGIALVRPAEARLVTEGAGVARAIRPDVTVGSDRALLIDVLAATRLQPAVVADREAGGGRGAAMEARPTLSERPATLPLARVVTTTFAPVPTIAEAQPAPRITMPALVARSAAGAATDETRATKLAAEQARDAARQAEAARAAADQESAAKTSADQAEAAKAAADQAKAAKDAAEQSKAAKVAAEQAKSAKEAADQAKAAKEAADQAKAAKEAAEQAKSAKEAADQAKAAKEAADQAKTVKEAADQAKAAKDAADQAKAAKEAADQAKAAKDAAEQAKAAKDAADQAKSAKDAADQAKAAKDAADQAKAAKDAADQAKAAKDAADQVKAAKDAADQAKAAKDAADQAKAAKDAADQAKAAKDAASQAKAAKEAADAAKEAAKAAKDAAKAAKDAAKAGKGN